MLDIPQLQQENVLIDMLADRTELVRVGKDGTVLGGVAEDWLKSLSDNRATNAAILESDAGPLEQDLGYENQLLNGFINVIKDLPATGSELSKRLRERWQDLFNREIDRNQEIIDATK